ncbi:MAG TPA: M15 family metallopeptidase [Acidimicrobiia bacterium]|nr:M15 family metallopeptidase [Acidimicrobiia bacterium]
MRQTSLAVILLVITACAVSSAQPTTTRIETTTSTSTTTTSTTTTTLPTTTTTIDPHARPGWLGTRLLPLRPDGHGAVLPTPPELVDRQLETIEYLDPPATATFEASIGEIPPDVLARSSWTEGCPVTVDELSYLTVTHHGFDGRLHTGELIVNVAVAEDVAEVFRRLFEAGFPIEQMRVTTLEEVDDHPTGDFNETGSFVCRPAVGSDNWSYHAYGLAVDINPFHNPYAKDDLVIPELASAYVDRENERVGMIYPGDVVTEAFADIGWEWGGNWNSLKDWMHFSATGR